MSDVDSLRHEEYMRRYIGAQTPLRAYVLSVVRDFHLMEDVATAEISRAQVWQWLRHSAELDDGRVVCPRLVAAVIDSEAAAIRRDVGDAAFHAGRFDEACELFSSLTLDYDMADFLTVIAYDRLDEPNSFSA